MFYAYSRICLGGEVPGFMLIVALPLHGTSWAIYPLLSGVWGTMWGMSHGRRHFALSGSLFQLNKIIRLLSMWSTSHLNGKTESLKQIHTKWPIFFWKDFKKNKYIDFKKLRYSFMCHYAFQPKTFFLARRKVVLRRNHFPPVSGSNINPYD